MIFDWEGNEADGYLARLDDLILYVAPLPNNLWSWSLTSISPLASIADHVHEDGSKETSIKAKESAEVAARLCVDETKQDN
jgi:hypothetical protein